MPQQQDHSYDHQELGHGESTTSLSWSLQRGDPILRQYEHTPYQQRRVLAFECVTKQHVVICLWDWHSPGTSLPIPIGHR